MELINSHIVPAEITAVRLTDYILSISQEFLSGSVSRNYVKNLIKHGNITINDKPAATAIFVEPGMKIELWEPDRKPVKIYKLKFPVIYEDDHLAVINKPAGIVVSGNRFRTIENALLNNINLSTQSDALRLPRPVHRLDALTSGLLLVAKTRSIRQTLGEMLEARKIKKTYQAIVIGKVTKNLKITTQINGQSAETELSLLKNIPSLKCDWLSLVELNPLTGRTHQLRLHLAGIGHPVLGDKLYGKEGFIYKGKGLFLCATELGFLHPASGEMLKLKINLPNKFNIHLKREAERWNKYN